MNVIFHFIDRFTIDVSSGELKTAVALDREIADQHNIRILSRDKGSPIHEAEVQVVVNVSDINDHKPAFRQRHYFVEVKEQQPAHVILNLTVGRINRLFDSACVRMKRSNVTTKRRPNDPFGQLSYDATILRLMFNSIVQK